MTAPAVPKFNDKPKADVTKHRSIWVAEEIWEHHKDILYANSSFWQWDGRIYRQIDDIDWMIVTAKRFPAFEEISPKQQKEVLEVYKRFAKKEASLFNKEDGLCFLNKYLDLNTLEVHDHDKKRINTILIPYEYDPAAQCLLWEKVLDDIFERNINNKKILQEFFGYCLTRDTKKMKALFMIGEGNTGKSTILDVLALMVGQDNVSVLSPRYYKDSMRVSAIENRLVLMSHEIPKRIEDYEAEFRQIVSGQTLEANPKHQKPYKFKPFCKVVWAMNELPRIDDHTSAFYNRVLPIEFNRIFVEEEQDKELLSKLSLELAGILNWSINGLKTLQERKCFLKDAYMKEHIEEMRLQNNPIASWVKEFIIIKSGSDIIKSEAYQKYSLWCGISGHRPVSSNKFGFEFYRILKATTKKDFRQGGGERLRVWPGLAWTTETGKEQQTADWNE